MMQIFNWRFWMVWFNKIFRRVSWMQYITHFAVNREPNGWSWNATLENERAADVIRLLVDVYQKSGAANLFSVEVGDPATMQSYLVTVQRKDGLTPIQIIQVYRDALYRIERHAINDPAVPKDILIIASQALDEVGYKEKETTND